MSLMAEGSKMTHKFIVVAALVIATPVLADETEIRLPGHRAVYELSFDSARTNTGVVGAEGRYVFDLEDACEGYALNERLVVQLARTNDRVLTDYRLSAFETSDGDQYRFATETEFDGKTGQEAEGNLTVGTESATVDYTKAETLEFDEPVLAPVAHVRAVLSAALAGEDRHAAMIFDGDIESPIFYAVTRISPDDSEEKLDAKGAFKLKGMKRWIIDSVYYPPETGTEGEGAVPQFAFSATLFENGIVDDLTLDYMDFALKATMSELEIRDSGC